MAKRKRTENDDAEENKIGRKRFDLTDDTISEIVRIMKTQNGLNIKVELLQINVCFKNNEVVYRINVNKGTLQSLPDFLENTKKVFQYFINIAKLMSTSGKDKVRFYISKAPRKPFNSLAKCRRPECHIFEKHMQNNTEEILNCDWSSVVGVFVMKRVAVKPTGPAKKTRS
jgi:hypothetical protein